MLEEISTTMAPHNVQDNDAQNTSINKMPQKHTPLMKNLTVDNITENVIKINSNCQNPRAKYLAERLVTHLHDFARETRLSTKEWMDALLFLTATGQKCDEFRQVRRHAIRCLNNGDDALLTDKLANTGIHPSLRRPWSLAPCGFDRPPETCTIHRGYGIGTIPYTRSQRYGTWRRGS